MSKISEIIAEAQSVTGRKTKNNEMYFQIVSTLCSDDEYSAKIVKAVNGKDIVTEDLKLAPAFKKIIVSILKKGTSMTEAEAIEFANSFKLNAEQAKTLTQIVHEADYIAMKNCNKKVQMFKKPDLDVAMTIDMAKESVRPNPLDATKAVKIAAHERLKVQQSLFPSQKTVIKRPSKK